MPHCHQLRLPAPLRGHTAGLGEGAALDKACKHTNTAIRKYCSCHQITAHLTNDWTLQSWFISAVYGVDSVFLGVVSSLATDEMKQNISPRCVALRGRVKFHKFHSLSTGQIKQKCTMIKYWLFCPWLFNTWWQNSVYWAALLFNIFSRQTNQ